MPVRFSVPIEMYSSIGDGHAEYDAPLEAGHERADERRSSGNARQLADKQA